MTYTAHPGTTTRAATPMSHVVTAILAIAGIVAAALGTWMAFGPDDGTLTLFNWTWNVADISELWALLLMIIGGAVTALAMGFESFKDWEAENRTWLIALEGLLTIAGIAAIVVGVVLLF